MYLPNSVKSKAGHSVKPIGVNHKLSMSEQKKSKSTTVIPGKQQKTGTFWRKKPQKG